MSAIKGIMSVFTSLYSCDDMTDFYMAYDYTKITRVSLSMWSELNRIFRAVISSVGRGQLSLRITTLAIHYLSEFWMLD